jgi:hypothetical protein
MINDSIEKFRQELFQLNVEKYQKQWNFYYNYRKDKKNIKDDWW